ncbi:F-box domain containing protein, partial [Tanacetum coccineum]
MDRDLRRHQHALAKSLQYHEGLLPKAKHLEGITPPPDLRCGGDQAALPRITTRSRGGDKYIKFWNDPKNLARAAQNRLNRQKSVVTSRQGSQSLARLRDEMRQASDTQEYPSLIDTFWRTHTVDGVFPKDEDRRIYEEMKRLEATGEYTEDEINALARGGKLRGHIPGVGRVLPSRATSRPSMPAPDKSLKSMHRKVDFMMSLFRSDSKYSDMFKEFESGGASGSGGFPSDKSLRIIVGDCIHDEDSPATIPQRHFDGDRFSQRHVAWESPEMLLGKTPIVVVIVDVAEDLERMMGDPHNIRNVSVIGHFGHGKSTLTYSLVAAAGLIAPDDVTGDTGMPDTDHREAERVVTTKLSGQYVHYKMNEAAEKRGGE